MSDVGRKDLSDKATEALKPDSEKSYAEQAKEKITDTYDDAAAAAQPDSQKSWGQTISDSISSGKDKATGEQTLADQAGEYVAAAKEKLGDAVEYISGGITGAKEGAKDGVDSVEK